MLDAKFLEVLKENGWKTTALAGACLTIYLLVEKGVIPTGDIHWWQSLPLTGFIIFSFLSLSSILQVIVKTTRPVLRRVQVKFYIYKRKKSLIKEIPFLTDVEREIIAYLLHHNQKLFEAEIDGDRASTLLAKGIIRTANTRARMIAFDGVPFEIPDYVWDVFYKRRTLHDRIEEQV